MLIIRSPWIALAGEAEFSTRVNLFIRSPLLPTVDNTKYISASNSEMEFAYPVQKVGIEAFSP